MCGTAVFSRGVPALLGHRGSERGQAFWVQLQLAALDSLSPAIFKVAPFRLFYTLCSMQDTVNKQCKEKKLEKYHFGLQTLVYS